MGDPKDPAELEGAIEQEVAPEWERRVTGAVAPGQRRDPDATLHVLVKVARPDHVPNGLVVRAAVSATMLTGQTTYRDLPILASDPLVVSVAISEPITPVKR